MKRPEALTVCVETQPAGKPQELPLELLEHVAGGLPYGGGWSPEADVVNALAAEGDLPYGGGWQ